MRWIVYLFSFYSLVLVSCGKSPILNHETESSSGSGGQGSASTSSVGATPVCNLNFESLGFCAEAVWIHSINTAEDGVLSLRFWKKTADSTIAFSEPGAKVLVSPVMICGHTPDYNPEKDQKSSGVYQFSKVSCPYPGIWNIKVQVFDAANILLEEKQIELSIK